MAKMTIMRGLPASGKSTKAKEILEHGNTVRINKDLLRTMLHCDKFTHHNESHTRDAARKLADWFLSNGVNVIIDDTNLNPGTVQSWKDLAKVHSAKIEYIDMTDVAVDECIERDEERDSKVGRHVIEKMAMQHLDYLKDKNIIVCDIDGTIADCKHRQHFVTGEKKDWKSFFEAMHKDAPRDNIIDDVYTEAVTSKSKIVFVSARPENYRNETLRWMYTNVPVSNPTLIMREGNDTRPDTPVKNDIYEKYLKKANIVKVFDDRPSVIRMWREKGLDVNIIIVLS